jgi:DNA-directed RNA polymerase subunit beta'
MLSCIDVASEMKRLGDEIPVATSVSKKDILIKRLKYLKGLHSSDLTPENAYVLHHIPVLPPNMRPATAMAGNRLEFSDVNMLYKDHMLVNNSLETLKDLLPPEELMNERKDLYNGAKAVFGFGDPISPSSKGRGLKGIAIQLGGVNGPKGGYFQSRVIGHKQDFSGRGTITGDANLKLNELGVPVDMLWTMYRMHIIRDLVKSGYNLIDAQNAYEARNPGATASFSRMTKDIPVILNRAPTLMKSNITAFMPTPVEGKTIGYNPLNLKLMAADYDGDAVSVFVPTTEAAIRELKEKMLPQTQLYDFRKGQGVSLSAPGHEAVMGAIHLTEADMKLPVVKFKTEKEALTALKDGIIKDNQPIQITG